MGVDARLSAKARRRRAFGATRSVTVQYDPVAIGRSSR